MIYSAEITLYPRDFVGKERTLIVDGNSLTISVSKNQDNGGDGGPWIVSDVLTATGAYVLFMNTPLKFTPTNGTTFEVA